MWSWLETQQINDMKQTPILFSTPMVQAILLGHKTETRRLRGLDSINEDPDKWVPDIFPTLIPIKGKADEYEVEFMFRNLDNEQVELIKAPYGWSKDILWVRETFCITQPEDPETYYFGYKAGSVKGYSQYPCSSKYDFSCDIDKWKPSIHMPKEACRIWLQIKDCYPQRLQALSEKSASAEGIVKKNDSLPKNTWGIDIEKGDKVHGIRSTSPILAFSSLWEYINGEHSWSKNPWVWTTEFKRINQSNK